MKILTILLSLLGCCMARSQWVAVNFYSAQSGAPTNLWFETDYQSNTNIRPGQILFTSNEWDKYASNNQLSFLAWQTNASNPDFSAAVKRSRIIALFGQIDAARTQMQAIQNTNLTTVAACAVAIKAEANVLDGILEELQRLGPVLRDIYKPDQDTTP